MGPDQALPLPEGFRERGVEAYIDSLLDFGTRSWLLQTLCGGVHILDFFTRDPDLYSLIIPAEWRAWFKSRDIMDILDLFMREDLQQLEEHPEESGEWRGGPAPPPSLVKYLWDVRRHLLDRDFPPKRSGLEVPKEPTMSRQISLGMKVKKIHEVDNFARYVDRLTADIAATKKTEITHIADFGSGQNYLGRALACKPYNKHIVAVESKHHNIEGAMSMDIMAKLVEKPIVMRNKKEFRKAARAAKAAKKAGCGPNGCPPVESTESDDDTPSEERSQETVPTIDDKAIATKGEQLKVILHELNIPADQKIAHLHTFSDGQGSIQYIEHRIEDGNLAPVIEQIVNTPSSTTSTTTLASTTAPTSNNSTATPETLDLTVAPVTKDPNLMVISLHSCGNLLHHGLRSITLNPAVSAVAMIGCCYNLMGERLGPPSYKLPSLRPHHPRLETTSSYDPHGFPMSDRLATYIPRSAPTHHTDDADHPDDAPDDAGVRWNITARMMAVQAPQNWGREESDAFFTRHFYRALLQRVFLDCGVVERPKVGKEGTLLWGAGRSPAGTGSPTAGEGGTEPIIVGNLRKGAYRDFVTYVRSALAKVEGNGGERGRWIREVVGGLSDEEIRAYEERFGERKKDLSVVWSLMAYSAGVVEAMIVVDRWSWLKEQPEVGEAWVEAVFDYRLSPRNLVVVGLKK